MGRGRTMEWAGRADHLGGIPRKIVFMAVGAFAKVVASLLNSTSVHNADTLIQLVRSRPPDVPLITVSNHMSTLVLLFLLILVNFLSSRFCKVSTFSLYLLRILKPGWMILLCGDLKDFLHWMQN